MKRLVLTESEFREGFKLCVTCDENKRVRSNWKIWWKDD